MSAQRIYVVDDDEAVCDSVEALLVSLGYDAVACGSAADFLAQFDASDAGCILLDVRLPGMDGLALLEQIDPRNRHVPVIMMTAHGDVPTAARAMRAGAADFVEKPFEPETLLKSLEGAMARAAEVPEPDPEVRARFERLTPRETEVMERMVEGLPNKLIAHALGMSPRTVEIHRGRVMQKTGARSLAEVVRLAIRAGCAPDDSA